MAVATFDTLKFSKALREAGVPEKQADAEAAVLAEALSVNLKDLANKDDLRLTEERFESKLKEVENRLTAKIEQSEQRTISKIEQSTAKTNSDIALLKGDIALLKWMMGLGLTVGIAVAVRLFFFPH